MIQNNNVGGGVGQKTIYIQEISGDGPTINGITYGLGEKVLVNIGSYVEFQANLLFLDSQGNVMPHGSGLQTRAVPDPTYDGWFVMPDRDIYYKRV